MKKIFLVFMALLVGVFVFASTTYAATTVSEVAITYDNLPFLIHEGDKLVMDSSAEGGTVGDILYGEQFLNSEYATSKWGFNSTDDTFRLYYNETNFAFSTGTTRTLAADFTDEWISWSVSGSIGTLEFLQDWPYEIDSFFTVNGTTYTPKTAYSYSDNISLYAHFEILGEEETVINTYDGANALLYDLTFTYEQVDYTTSYDLIHLNIKPSMTLNFNENESIEILNFYNHDDVGDMDALALEGGTVGGLTIYPPLLYIRLMNGADDTEIDNVRVMEYIETPESISITLDQADEDDYYQIDFLLSADVDVDDFIDEITTVGSDVEINANISELFSVKYFVADVLTSTVLANQNSLIVRPTDPVKENYIFVGWFDDDNNLWDFSSDRINETSLILNAVFVADTETLYDVEFDTNGGSELDDVIIIDGNLILQPNNPTKEGYVFVNWYTDTALTTPFDFTTVIEDDIVLYARYVIGEYSISFDTNGGSAIEPIVGSYNDLVQAPTDPTRTGYTFVGWYADEDLTTLYTFDNLPADNITVYAKWVSTSNTIAIISEPGEPLQIFGIAWYIWVIGAAAIYYFGFNKNGRKVLGLK